MSYLYCNSSEVHGYYSPTLVRHVTNTFHIIEVDFVILGPIIYDVDITTECTMIYYEYEYEYEYGYGYGYIYIAEYIYLFVNNRLAMPAAIPTAAATVTPPMAASFIFLLSACSLDSILER